MARRPSTLWFHCSCVAMAALAVVPAASRADLPDPYRVVCTTGMVADIVREVTRGAATVESLIGAGVDPHLHVATRADVARLLDADVVFYNGLLLEGQMGEVLSRVKQRMPVVAVAESVDKKLLLADEEVKAHHDPHLWMDVSLWKQCTQKVAKTLSSLDPAKREVYESNLLRYGSELDALHEYARKCIGTIPEDGRVLVTAHDAFRYMGRAYGLEVVGIQGISTESEAGIADINRIVARLVDGKIKAVFVESSVSDKNVKALLEGTAARGHAVKIGGTLFSDAMGTPGTYEGTYIGMIDHNITTITQALGGVAPAKGLHGRLGE